MEKSCVPHGNIISRCNFYTWVIRQLLHLGPEVKWSNTICHNVICWSYVVWNFISTRIHRILLWLSQTTLRAACSNQSNSKTSSHPNLVHASSSLHACCRSIAVWSLLYRTILHLFCYLWESILLPIWISVSSVHYFGGFLQPNKVSRIKSDIILGFF